MKRFEDWPERLHTFIESRREAAFSWGTNDCCMFCADAIQAITGDDLAAEWRGEYSDEAGAQKFLFSLGGIEEIVTSILGEPFGPLCARRGDIVLLEVKGRPVIGVCTGNHVAAPGDNEQIMFLLERGLKSWRVG